MGKSIIFSDADFSQNGFEFGTITKVYNQLEDNKGNIVAVEDIKNVTAADSAYLLGNSGIVSGSFAGNVCTDYVDVEGFENFVWKGLSRSAIEKTAMGIVCFYDAAKTFIGSYTLNRVDNPLVEGGAIIKVYSEGLPLTTINGNIPNNAKYARCHCYRGATEFSFTVSKVVEK